LCASGQMALCLPISGERAHFLLLFKDNTEVVPFVEYKRVLFFIGVFDSDKVFGLKYSVVNKQEFIKLTLDVYEFKAVLLKCPRNVTASQT